MTATPDRTAGGGPVDVGVAHPDEHTRLGTIIVTAYRGLGVPLDEGYAAFLADVAGRAADPANIVLAARIGGEPVGCATVALPGSRLREEAPPGDAVLRTLAVAPESQGLGAGRALLGASLAAARAAGCPRVHLTTREVMRTARLMYESAGFRRQPEGDRVVGDGIALLAYVLDLEVVDTGGR